MRHGKSAVVSAVLLGGFPVVAWSPVLLALLVASLVLATLPAPFAVRIAVPLTAALAGPLWYATVRALRLPRPSPVGVPLARPAAPDLFSMLDEAAAAARVRPPDGVTVVAAATVTLVEQVRSAGLRGGRRELFLGLPLLLAWDETHVRAAVAHELAHGSPRLGRLAPFTYRSRLALGRIVPRISRRSPVGPLLRAYARWVRRCDARFGREQELAADQIAAEFAGARPTVEALYDGPVLEALQQLFNAEVLSPGWAAGVVPDDVFGGLLRVLASCAEDLPQLAATAPEPVGEWDTHPLLADRVAALAALAAVAPPDEARRPAGDLLPDLPGLARALQAVAFPPAGRTVVSWDEFLDAARTAELQREADAALRAVSRLAGVPVAGLTDVLDLIADGRLEAIAQSLFGDSIEQASARATDLVWLLLVLCGLGTGVARWRHSWAGGAELVTQDGTALDVRGLAELATRPATRAEALEHLAALGIDPAATASGAGWPPVRVAVLGGVVNMLVNGARTDLLIVATGLFLVPGLPRSRSRTREAKRRLNRIAADGLLADGSPLGHAAGRVLGADPTAAIAAPGRTGQATVPAQRGTRFVPFNDVAGASAARRKRHTWAVSLRDGGALNLRTAPDSAELPGGWTALDETVAFLCGNR